MKKILISVVLLTIIFSYFQFIDDSLQKYKNLKQKKEEKITQIKRQKVLAKEQNNERKKFNDYLEDLKSRQQKSLSYVNRDKLFLDIINYAQNSNVKIDYIRPKPRQEKDVYSVFTVNVKVKGNYNQVFNFLEKINDINYLARFKEMQMVLTDKQKIDLQFKVINYVTKAEVKGGDNK